MFLSYNHLDDFTALTTATVLQALPDLSRLAHLMSHWTVRIAVLRKTPKFLADLDTSHVALRSAWHTFGLKDPLSISSESHSNGFVIPRQDLSKVALDNTKSVLGRHVTSIGKQLDTFLDTLEGREETVPEDWIDRVDTVEAGYGDWVVQAERRVLENDLRLQAEIRERQNTLRLEVQRRERELREEEAELSRKLAAQKLELPTEPDSKADLKPDSKTDATLNSKLDTKPKSDPHFLSGLDGSSDERKENSQRSQVNEEKVALPAERNGDLMPESDHQDHEDEGMPLVVPEGQSIPAPTISNPIRASDNLTSTEDYLPISLTYESNIKKSRSDPSAPIPDNLYHKSALADSAYVQESVSSESGDNDTGAEDLNEVSRDQNSVLRLSVRGKTSKPEIASTMLGRSTSPDGILTSPDHALKESVKARDSTIIDDFNDRKNDILPTEDRSRDMSREIPNGFSITLGKVSESKTLRLSSIPHQANSEFTTGRTLVDQTPGRIERSSSASSMPSTLSHQNTDDTLPKGVLGSALSNHENVLPKSPADSDKNNSALHNHRILHEESKSEKSQPRTNKAAISPMLLSHSLPLDNMRLPAEDHISTDPEGDQKKLNGQFDETTPPLVEYQRENSQVLSHKPSSNSLPNSLPNFPSTLAPSSSNRPAKSNVPAVAPSRIPFSKRNGKIQNERTGSTEVLSRALTTDTPPHKPVDSLKEEGTRLHSKISSDPSLILPRRRDDELSDPPSSISQDSMINHQTLQEAPFVLHQHNGDMVEFGTTIGSTSNKGFEADHTTSGSRNDLKSTREESPLEDSRMLSSPYASDLEATDSMNVYPPLLENAKENGAMISAENPRQYTHTQTLTVMPNPEVKGHIINHGDYFLAGISASGSQQASEEIPLPLTLPDQESFESEDVPSLESHDEDHFDPEMSPSIRQYQKHKEFVENQKTASNPLPILRVSKRRSRNMSNHEVPMLGIEESQKSPSKDEVSREEANLGSPLYLSPSKQPENHLEQKISSILTSIPGSIRLTTEADAVASVRRRIAARKSQGTPPPRISRASTASPSFALAPAPTKQTRPRPQHSNPDIKLYHLHRSSDEAPIKLFVRLVGESGERVMVRVGGGWADLGEYLKEYASHHGRRSTSDGRVEIQDIPGGSGSNSAKLLSGRATPTGLSRPSSAMGRSVSSLGIRRSRLSDASPTEEGGSPFTPFLSGSGNRRVMSEMTPGSATSSNRPSSRMSWTEEESSLGLAGPKSKKTEMSKEKQAWVEGMIGQVRKASAEKKAREEWGDLGRVEGVRRVFKKT
jgi:hypothetical protein